jgi:uncharacterized tellurite resistance protein B-like protein
MFKKIFKKKEENKKLDGSILIAALLIHAAKIDENYSEVEKKIIKKSIIELHNVDSDLADEIMLNAEKKESQSNQIVEFTSEIKKYPMESRLKIIEVIWKIVYSDSISDDFESNLIRRICGLLYVSDKDNGIIKTKVKKSLE